MNQDAANQTRHELRLPNSNVSIPHSELVFISLGSNLGKSQDIIRAAMKRLQLLSGAPILKSSLWQTAPVDCPPGSPDFINAAVGLAPLDGTTPESMLQKLLQWERDYGLRRRDRPNEPRILDLDLIAFGLETRATDELALPHPRACERAFVLYPLAEIAPDLKLPGQSQTVEELRDALTDPGQIQRID